MRILFLTQIVPFPPDAGPKVKTWLVLRYLAQQGHSVILVSFVRPEEGPGVARLREVCEEVHTVPMQRSRIKDVWYWFLSMLSRRPFLVERDDLSGMRKMVEYLLNTRNIDVIHADQLTMTQFGFPPASITNWLKRPPVRFDAAGIQVRPSLIFDAHNATWTILERMKSSVPRYLRPLLALESHRIKAFEAGMVLYADHTLTVSEEDRQSLMTAVYATNKGSNPGGGSALDKVKVIPIAVDTQALRPIRRMNDSPSILTLGTLHYPPNADGIRWFLQEVFPIIQQDIPEVTLTVIGKNPPQDFVDAANREPDAIRVTGYVPDLEPYLQEAALVVVPVRAGGGIRVRILEAFAWAMPIVTTSIGLEGIDARPGEHVLIADTPEEFAWTVVRALKDEVLRTSLSVNGRWLVESCYDWRIVLRELDSLYDLVAEERGV